MSTQKKINIEKQYLTNPICSSVCSYNKIEIPTETDGVQRCQKKTSQHFIFTGIQNWSFSMWRKEK